jgi:hypothetical protein
MEEFVQKRNDKIKLMREEKAKKEIENCQFAPNIYTRKHGETQQRRNFEQFIKDQRRFIDNVRQKNNQMIEERQ